MAAPPLKVVEHPQNGVAAYFLERPPGVGSTRGEDSLGVETALADFRDVLMSEYDERIDYKAELKRLGLERPYPV